MSITKMRTLVNAAKAFQHRAGVETRAVVLEADSPVHPERRHRLSRRRFCLCCFSAFAAAGAGWLPSRKARAELLGGVELIRYEVTRTPVAIHKLCGNVAVLEGSGCDVAVLSGVDGKLLVDAGIAVSRPQMETALPALGPEPVTHVINALWHFDDANGNEWLQELRPEFIAHENTRKQLATT